METVKVHLLDPFRSSRSVNGVVALRSRGKIEMGDAVYLMEDGTVSPKLRATTDETLGFAVTASEPDLEPSAVDQLADLMR